MSKIAERFEWMAKSFVGWPDCRCGASDYRVVKTEPSVTWVEPNGTVMPKRNLYCRHRRIELALIRAYRSGREAARA